MENVLTPKRSYLKKRAGQDIYGYFPSEYGNRITLTKYLLDKKNNTWIKKSCFAITNEIEAIGQLFTISECFPMAGSHDVFLDMLRNLNETLMDIVCGSVKKFDNFIRFLNYENLEKPRAFKQMSNCYCIMQRDICREDIRMINPGLEDKSNQNWEKIEENYIGVFRMFYMTGSTIHEIARFIIDKSQDKQANTCHVVLLKFGIPFTWFGKVPKPATGVILINYISSLVEDTRLIYYKESIKKCMTCGSEFIVLCSMLSSRLLELLMKTKYKNIQKELQKYMWIDTSYPITKTFGVIEYDKSLPLKLHHILGIPNYALEMYDKALEADIINKHPLWVIRGIFKDNEDFLINMDKEKFKEIFSFIVYEIEPDSLMESTFTSIMGHLIDIFGCKNCHLYLRYFKKLTKDIDEQQIYGVSNDMPSAKRIFSCYCSYVCNLSRIKKSQLEGMDCYEMADDLLYEKRWKFKSGNEIMRYHINMEHVITIIKEERQAGFYKQGFDRVKNDFAPYEYTGKKYSIMAPGHARDILREGKELHHCVGGYLEAVCNRITTIMFIRKNTELDKPFFTLEIRDGEIRQCHGFANCDIETENGMKEFLEEYCSIKKIEFDEEKASRRL